MSKHWPGAYELRAGTPQKCNFFMQLSVKKAITNGEGKKGGHRDETQKKFVTKSEPKAVKH